MQFKIPFLALSLLFSAACSATTNTDFIADNNSPANNPVYTLSEIAQHKTKTDCWMAIGGSVYNVTPSTTSGKHPGGDAILAGCGIDATTLFETRPMGTGTPHSEKAHSYLENYKIGKLQ
jgi:cytochrome b involved in lipid metabolism